MRQSSSSQTTLELRSVRGRTSFSFPSNCFLSFSSPFPHHLLIPLGLKGSTFSDLTWKGSLCLSPIHSFLTVVMNPSELKLCEFWLLRAKSTVWPSSYNFPSASSSREVETSYASHSPGSLCMDERQRARDSAHWTFVVDSDDFTTLYIGVWILSLSLTHSSTNLLQRDELEREQSMRALKGIKAVTKNAFSRDIWQEKGAMNTDWRKWRKVCVELEWKKRPNQSLLKYYDMLFVHSFHTKIRVIRIRETKSIPRHAWNVEIQTHLHLKSHTN